MKIDTTDSCSWLHERLESLPLIAYPFDLNILPDNGIYFFYEKGEMNGHGKNSPRIVRVGTHKEGNFKSRINSHYLIKKFNFSETTDGPKDRSIFRKHIGRALLNLRKPTYLPVWKDWNAASEARDITFERELENEITEILRSNFTFKYLTLDGQRERMGKDGLESRLIGTLSHCQHCKPSPNWLGNSVPAEYHYIKEYGLWLKHYLKYPGITEEDKDSILTAMGKKDKIPSIRETSPNLQTYDSFRLATPSDKEGILGVISSYPEKWDRKIAQKYYDDYFGSTRSFKNDAVYVGVIGNEIIGVIGYSLDKYETENYWLGWFYVHQKFNGRGFGGNIFSLLEQKLKEKRIKKLFVSTSSNKFYKKALGFYIEKGFKIEAVIKDYYERGEDQIILSKKF